nr:MAG TPA: SprT-like family protein [Caudoviricetes sp.]
MENTKINVLGTEYTICERTEEQDCRLKNCDGYCDKTSKEIVIIKITDDNCDLHKPKWYTDKLLRHEIVHAFLFESGMHECTNWDAKDSCHNEQLVDWFAIQSPKIFKVYQELGILDLHTPDLQFSVNGPDGKLQRTSITGNFDAEVIPLGQTEKIALSIAEAVQHAVDIQKGI